MHHKTSNQKFVAVRISVLVVLLFSVDQIYGTIVSGYSCNFTVDFCSWKDDGNFTRRDRATPSQDTGPDTGHTQRPNGQHYDYYIYIESNVREAELLGPSLGVDCRDYCFRFWYHMYGARINKAEVGVMDNARPLWIKYGNQNNSWHCGFVALENTICHDKQIYVRAYGTEGAVQTDIAFDDLALLKDVPCNSTVCNVNGDVTTQRATTADEGVTPPSSTVVSKDQDTPKSTKDDSTSTSPYIYLSLLALPFIVLVAGIIFVCVRKNKDKPERDAPRDSRDSVDSRYIRDPTGNSEEEVYDTIDEIPIDGDYVTPYETDNGYIDALSVCGPGVSHTANGDYLFPTSMDSAGSMGSLSYLHRNLDRQALGNDYLSPTSVVPPGSMTNDAPQVTRNPDKRTDSENHSYRDSQDSFNDYDQASGIQKPELPKRLETRKLVSQNKHFNDYENPVSKSIAMANLNVETPPPDYDNSAANTQDRKSSTSL